MDIQRVVSVSSGPVPVIYKIDGGFKIAGNIKIAGQIARTFGRALVCFAILRFGCTDCVPLRM